MPHLMIDYSANVEPDVDMRALCDALRDVAASMDAFPLAGVKVRAVRVDHYAIADGSPEHGFIDISVRIREGRDMKPSKMQPRNYLTRPMNLLRTLCSADRWRCP